MKGTMSSAQKRIAVLAWIGALALILSTISQVVYALPPRPDPPQKGKDPSKGGGIELHIDPLLLGAGPGIWAVVQWQDGLGGWHDVDGWRGELEGRERIIWWVSPDHFGAGPFRWLVYRGSDGEVLATSASFDLPQGHGHLVRVEVLLAE